MGNYIVIEYENAVDDTDEFITTVYYPEDTDGLYEVLDEIGARRGVVCDATGADIITVLHDMGEGEIVRDPEELKKVMDYLESKLEIPWVKHVEAALDVYSWRKNN